MRAEVEQSSGVKVGLEESTYAYLDRICPQCNDFTTGSAFVRRGLAVGVARGVNLSICPCVTIIDYTEGVLLQETVDNPGYNIQIRMKGDDKRESGLFAAPTD